MQARTQDQCDINKRRVTSLINNECLISAYSYGASYIIFNSLLKASL